MTSTSTRAPKREGTSLDLDTIRNVLVTTLIIGLPFAMKYLLLVNVHSPHLQRFYLRATLVGPLDVILVLLALASVPLLIRRNTYRGWPIGLIGVAAFTVVTLLFLVPEPTTEGVVRLIRLAGITGLVATVRWMSPPTWRLAVIWPLTISVGIQAIWTISQTFIFHNGRETSITARFDHVWTHGEGTMDGGYALAAFMVLGIAIILSSGAFERIHPVMWGTVILASGAISATFGRQGILAGAAIAVLYGVAWIVKRRKVYLASSLAAGLPMTIGVAIAWEGWNVRAAETAAGEQWGRESLIDRALSVIEANPIFGVGPADYGPALARMGLTDVDITIVHNVPLLMAAEYGIPVGVLFVLWIGLLGLAALFTSVRAAAVFVAVAPYLIFDHPHIVYVYAIIQLGLWLSVLDYHRLWESGAAKQGVEPAQS